MTMLIFASASLGMGLLAGFAALCLSIALAYWIHKDIKLSISLLTDYAVSNREARSSFPRLPLSEFEKLAKTLEETHPSSGKHEAIEAYVQSLTHEIKSPLTAIRGAAELCQLDTSEEQRQRFLANIRTESERIQNLIETLLDISALESRQGRIEPAPLELNAIVEDVVISLEPVFIKKGVHLSYHPSEGDLSFHGERFLITQSIRNLLQNAIEFSPTGGVIELRTERRPQEVALSIKDHGPGIPDYALPRVFEKFYSLGRPHSGRKSSGLGLSFVREATSLHRGKIEVRNHKERNEVLGTIATLALPSNCLSQKRRLFEEPKGL